MSENEKPIELKDDQNKEENLECHVSLHRPENFTTIPKDINLYSEGSQHSKDWKALLTLRAFRFQK